MNLNLFILIGFSISKLVIKNQSFYFSDIETEEPIDVPNHCFILGFPCAKDSSTLKSFTLFKPVRKMHEYAYDIERGLELASDYDNISLDDRVLDSIAYPDLSSQAVGMAMGGILLALLFKLFT